MSQDHGFFEGHARALLMSHLGEVDVNVDDHSDDLAWLSQALETVASFIPSQQSKLSRWIIGKGEIYRGLLDLHLEVYKAEDEELRAEDIDRCAHLRAFADLYSKEV